MSREDYIRFIDHEQARVASVLRDGETLAERSLSASQLILEHADRDVADNLIWDGRGWRIHMHLAPYGSGLFFDVITSEANALVDLARPMAEQFPVRTWQSTALVDLEELAEQGAIAEEVVRDLTNAARALAVSNAPNRTALEAKLALQPDEADKLVAFPEVDAPGRRSLTVMNFDSPVSLARGVVFGHEIAGIPYRTRHLTRRPTLAGGLASVLSERGIDGDRFRGALGPDSLATSADPRSARSVELRVGTGLAGEGTRMDVHWIVSGAGVRSALSATLGGLAPADALLSGLAASLAWQDSEGRRVYRVQGAANEGPQQTTARIAAEDPDAWYDAGGAPPD